MKVVSSKKFATNRGKYYDKLFAIRFLYYQ